MKKYIDADKLIERLEEMKRAEYENCGGVNSKTGALQEVQELIDSLQQEQREVDLENVIEEYWIANGWSKVITLGKFKVIARYFYRVGQLNSK